MNKKLPADFNVSRETMDLLAHFAQLVEKWTQKINLVSKSSVQDIWERHILDSLQIAKLGIVGSPWVDIGSGGGFPGIIAAISARESRPFDQFVLIESDLRKCAFLREAARHLDLNVSVLSQRIEETAPQGAEVLSARALTELSGLLFHAERHLARKGTALFMKGAQWEKEVETARESWSFDLQLHKSITHQNAVILEVNDLARL